MLQTRFVRLSDRSSFAAATARANESVFPGLLLAASRCSSWCMGRNPELYCESLLRIIHSDMFSYIHVAGREQCQPTYCCCSRCHLLFFARFNLSHPPQVCQTHCAGSAFFGVQYAIECWCSGTASLDYPYDIHGASTGCTAPCSGNADENCGGDWAMNVYKNV